MKISDSIKAGEFSAEFPEPGINDTPMDDKSLTVAEMKRILHLANEVAALLADTIARIEGKQKLVEWD